MLLLRGIKTGRDSPNLLIALDHSSSCIEKWQRKRTIRWLNAGKAMPRGF
jgi:hypothetical protein